MIEKILITVLFEKLFVDSAQCLKRLIASHRRSSGEFILVSELTTDVVIHLRLT